MPKDTKLPLVYSCSGCSSAAQAANQIALQLDRQGVAEMSCIAGVGGDVPHLVKIATSGRPVIALDGCALACARHCLARHGVEPNHYYQLQEYGVKKRYHADFDAEQAQTVLEKISVDIHAVTTASADNDSAVSTNPASINLASINPVAE
ncbi:MAG: putative zinc-binding protein [Proteobacteria bacterium]|nr:putative zinc-binding protein [Pseudomonadota bacterium]